MIQIYVTDQLTNKKILVDSSSQVSIIHFDQDIDLNSKLNYQVAVNNSSLIVHGQRLVF